jgi:hypothetical protein
MAARGSQVFSSKVNRHKAERELSGVTRQIAIDICLRRVWMGDCTFLRSSLKANQEGKPAVTDRRYKPFVETGCDILQMQKLGPVLDGQP